MNKSIEEKLDEILEIVKKLEEKFSKKTFSEDKIPGAISSKNSVDRKMSMKELLLQYSPKGDVQKTLIMGYFFELYGGMTSFNKADVEKGYKAIKEKPPININDKINMSIRKGHIREEDEKKNNKTAWSLTPSGEEFIKNGFKKSSNS